VVPAVAVAVVALMVAEEHADVQARNVELRRALCLLRSAQRQEESRTLRVRE